MNFRVNTDTWFVFCILFISALALCIVLYITIPFLIRKRQVNRIKSKHQKKILKYNQLERKKTILKLSSQEDNIKKLKTDISDYLYQITQSDSNSTNLLPFYSNFEKMYPNFSHSLKKISPNISANELKLCALLRLNLSSKEIGQLLNITQDSVNKARYRIRKKLELTSKEDIFTTLLNIN
jgi:DNA-binding CsgD family transcriptional regulator